MGDNGNLVDQSSSDRRRRLLDLLLEREGYSASGATAITRVARDGDLPVSFA